MHTPKAWRAAPLTAQTAPPGSVGLLQLGVIYAGTEGLTTQMSDNGCRTPSWQPCDHAQQLCDCPTLTQHPGRCEEDERRHHWQSLWACAVLQSAHTTPVCVCRDMDRRRATTQNSTGTNRTLLHNSSKTRNQHRGQNPRLRKPGGTQSKGVWSGWRMITAYLTIGLVWCMMIP